MGDDALMPLRLFRSRAVRDRASCASVVVGAGMFGGIVLLPLYLQIVHGASPTEAGPADAAAGARHDAGVDRLRPDHLPDRPLPDLPAGRAALLMIAACCCSRRSAPTRRCRGDRPFMVVLGLGLGNCMQPLMLALQNAVPPRDMGVATSSATFFRQIGGTLGVAVFLSILFSTRRGQHRRRAARRGGPARVPSAVAGRDCAAATRPTRARRWSGRQRSVRRAARPHRHLDRAAARPGAGPAVPGRLRRLDATVFLVVTGVAAVALILVLVLEGGAAAHQGGLQARAAEARE